MARAVFFPDITLSALIGFRNTGEAALLSAPYSFWTLGPQFVLPLFEGGLLWAREEAAEATRRREGGAYRTVVLAAFQQVEDSLSNLRILRQELAQEAAASARRAADRTMSLYRDGATNDPDVVVSQTALLQAEQSAPSLQTLELQASVALIWAVGGGWTRDDRLETLAAN